MGQREPGEPGSEANPDVARLDVDGGERHVGQAGAAALRQLQHPGRVVSADNCSRRAHLTCEHSGRRAWPAAQVDHDLARLEGERSHGHPSVLVEVRVDLGQIPFP